MKMFYFYRVAKKNGPRLLIPWNNIGMAQAISLYYFKSSTRPAGLFLVLLAELSITETVSAGQAQPILPKFRPKM